MLISHIPIFTYIFTTLNSRLWFWENEITIYAFKITISKILHLRLSPHLIFHLQFSHRSYQQHHPSTHITKSLPAIEVTWRTHCWENRVFAFILAVSEINSFLFLRFFVWKPSNTKEPTLLQFRRSLALQLIDNEWIVNIVDDSPRRWLKRQQVALLHRREIQKSWSIQASYSEESMIIRIVIDVVVTVIIVSRDTFDGGTEFTMDW